MVDLRGYAIGELTFANLLADQAAKLGDKTFLTSLPDRRAFSYRDIDVLTNRLANGMLDLGITPGSHAAVMMDNCPEQLLVYFALAKIGVVWVAVNTAVRGDLLRYYLENSHSTVLIGAPDYLARLAEIAPSVPAVRTVIRVAPAGEGEGEGPSPDLGPMRVVDYEELAGSRPEAPGVAVDPMAIAMLGYTSGTTGPSKGNIVTQAGLLMNAFAGADLTGSGEEDVYYICLPVNHSNGFWTVLQAFVSSGSVVLARRFSASGYWDDIRASGATRTNLLGVMTNILWGAPPSPSDRDNPLKAVLISPMPEFADAFETRFGLKLLGGYGLTDFCGVTFYGGDELPGKRLSAGRARPGIAIRIGDAFDEALPAGEVGEILLRSDNPWRMAQGYYGMPEATIAANRNQWFHTGDRGYLDADSYLYFVDRVKDSIRRRGENISAFEVEAIIGRHPAVLDVAVYPVASEMSEDEVAASIILRDGAEVTEAEIVAHCSANMAYFMVPRYVRFVRELPLTISQKVEKYKLRAEAEANRQLLWDREAAGIELAR